MKKITLLGVMAGLCLYTNSFAQKTTIEPFYIGDRVPDLPLNRIINYKDSAASLSSFGEKLIILDFWSTHCASCIAMLPMEDSLQQAMNDKLQFILVTIDPKEKVASFLKRWENLHQAKLSMPIVCSDSVLSYLFRHHSVPHYAWLAPDGSLLAQTSGEHFINATSIQQLLLPVLQSIEQRHKDGFPPNMTSYPPVPSVLLKMLKRNKLPGNGQ